ncbi:YgaP family membrane protein [Variovorax sp. PBL-E5]|uniref:YgaP family membrane protein n=1 Tax=Variovorax sp. PBL-E5 TaxID=434014 RepID=UPI0013A5B4A3|nr:DUF2892 domain-containing protein [Variovorax sp. PBL-E5]
MNRNIGLTDRTLRIGAGAALVLLAAIGTIGPWGYFGLIPLVTGLVGSCPLYSLFRFGTQREHRGKASGS